MNEKKEKIVESIFARRRTGTGDEITRFARLCKVIAFWTELYRVSAVHANLAMAGHA